MTGSRIFLKRNQGYTLVELLVAMSIFSIAMVVVGTLFVAFTTAQANAGSKQRIVNDGNFILTSIAREVRMRSVDYTCPTDSDSLICLRDETGSVTRFYYEATAKNLYACIGSSAAACPLSSPSTVWQRLNPATITIVQFHAYVLPMNDPSQIDESTTLTELYRSLYQPSISINMQIEAGQGRSLQRYSFQTVASSRVYVY